MNLLHNLLRWPWTPWADILTFRWGDGGYLLQGRRNRITGRAQFAVRKMGQWWRVIQAPAPSEEALQKVGLWNPEP